MFLEFDESNLVLKFHEFQFLVLELPEFDVWCWNSMSWSCGVGIHWDRVLMLESPNEMCGAKISCLLFVVLEFSEFELCFWNQWVRDVVLEFHEFKFWYWNYLSSMCGFEILSSSCCFGIPEFESLCCISQMKSVVLKTPVFDVWS